MSIEQHLKELTEAVKANTEAMLASVAQRGEIVKKAETIAAKVATEAKPAKATKAEAKAPVKDESDKDPVMAIRKRFGKFLSENDKAEQKKRMEFVEAILERFGVEKSIQIPADKLEKVFSWLDAFEDGKFPTWYDPSDESAEDEDEAEEEAPPAKKKKVVVDEDDDEDEKPVAKKKKKAPVADDDDED